MSAHRLLQDLFRAPYESYPDPGNSSGTAYTNANILPDREEFYMSFTSSTAADTRVLIGPPRAGLEATFGMTSYYGSGNLTLYIYDSLNNLTGTVMFNGTAQWVELCSVEQTPGYYVWRLIQGAGVGNSMPEQVSQSAAVYTTGGTTASNAQLITTQTAILNVSAAGKWFKLPPPALGLEIQIINETSATQILMGNNGENISLLNTNGGTTVAIGATTGNTTAVIGCAPVFLSDGTNWFRVAV